VLFPTKAKKLPKKLVHVVAIWKYGLSRFGNKYGAHNFLLPISGYSVTGLRYYVGYCSGVGFFFGGGSDVKGKRGDYNRPIVCATMLQLMVHHIFSPFMD
jgi:hypothetical protein